MTAEWTLRDAELSSAAHDTKGAGRASAEAVRGHLDQVLPALESLRSQSHQLAAWGEELALRLL
ncbi:MAG TPA: phosphoheptose isomerase, partial [Arthrobacter sp.]|nr:phosphoheptose isomerase [Arthrobacter sp.]